MAETRLRPGLLVVCRMSPRLKSRTRILIQSVSECFGVKVISESNNGVRNSYRIDGAEVSEVVLPFPNKRFWYFTGGIHVFVYNLIAVIEVFRQNSLIVVCSDALYIFAGLAAKLFGRKFVYNAHEIAWGMGDPKMLSDFLGWLESLAIRFCDLWFVPSEKRGQMILDKHNLHKPYVVYENLPIFSKDTQDFGWIKDKIDDLNIPKDKPIIIFQGALTTHRGLEQLLRAAQNGHFHLIIQGQGKLLSYLQIHAHSHMTLLEPCPNDQAIAWLSQADLSFVYYENDCLNSAYACSSKFYVSVFAGIPILCNRLPAFEIFSEQYGGVVFIDSMNEKCIEDTIKNLFDTPGSYERLKQDLLFAREALVKIPRKEIISQAIAGLTN